MCVIAVFAGFRSGGRHTAARRTSLESRRCARKDGGSHRTASPRTPRSSLLQLRDHISSRGVALVGETPQLLEVALLASNLDEHVACRGVALVGKAPQLLEVALLANLDEHVACRGVALVGETPQLLEVAPLASNLDELVNRILVIGTSTPLRSAAVRIVHDAQPSSGFPCRSEQAPCPNGWLAPVERSGQETTRTTGDMSHHAACACPAVARQPADDWADLTVCAASATRRAQMPLLAGPRSSAS